MGNAEGVGEGGGQDGSGGVAEGEKEWDVVGLGGGVNR